MAILVPSRPLHVMFLMVAIICRARYKIFVFSLLREKKISFYIRHDIYDKTQLIFFNGQAYTVTVHQEVIFENRNGLRAPLMGPERKQNK